MAFVRRFMSVFGPISSIFDAATFVVMLWVLHASHEEFRTGWFVESLASMRKKVIGRAVKPSSPAIGVNGRTAPQAAAAIGMTSTLVGFAKQRFYAAHRPQRQHLTTTQRHERRIQRRAARYTHHRGPAPS